MGTSLLSYLDMPLPLRYSSNAKLAESLYSVAMKGNGERFVKAQRQKKRMREKARHGEKAIE